MARILFQTSPERTQPFDLDKDSLNIGRSDSCDISINHDFVSGRHARLDKEKTDNGEEWQLTDLDSSNGTFVNGIRITKTRLAGGDQLAFGTLEATFEADGQVATVTQAVTLEALEGEAREAYLRATLLRNQIKGLRKTVADLEDRKEALAEPIEVDAKTKMVYAGEIIDRLDRVEDLMAALGRQTYNESIHRQVGDLRESLLDWLKQYGVTPFTYPAGTQITEEIVPRVRAVGRDIEAMGEGASTGRISRTRRPGYEFKKESGDEANDAIVIRKAEITADIPTSKA